MSGPQPAHKITPAWYCLLAFVSIIAGGIFPLTGCKTMGYLFKDFASKKSVPAAFQLTHDPLLILVDDDQEWCTWAGGRDHLTEQIAKSLNESGANTKSIPVSQINSIRQSHPNFSELSIREVGKAVGAQQIMWVQIRAFSIPQSIDQFSGPTVMTVRVKVFNPNTEEKSGMRLWPASPEGEIVTATIDMSHMPEYKNTDDLARALVDDLGLKVAQLFFDHSEEENKEQSHTG